MSQIAWACGLACVIAWPVAAQTQTPAPASPPDTSARAVIAKAVDYLEEYRKTLQFVLADEVTVQEVFRRLGSRAVSPSQSPTERRVTSGEFFLTYLAADGGWIGVRDIAVVDGTPVGERDNLRDLLTKANFARIGRQLADRNARHNIGSVLRNVNDPMLALVMLENKNRDRFKFERRRVEPSPTGPLVTVAFTERDGPTLVRGADGRNIFAKGEMIIDAATGHIRRTLVTLKIGPTDASLTTDFAQDAKLGLWLPASMTERYDHSTSKVKELVVVGSAYTNYRRFDAKVTIK